MPEVAIRSFPDEEMRLQTDQVTQIASFPKEKCDKNASLYEEKNKKTEFFNKK